MKKVFASDFDNTLYFPYTGFRKEDLLAIKAFQKEGNLFGLSTGRSLEGITEPTGKAIDYDFYLLATGAFLLGKNQRVLYRKTLSFEAVEAFSKKYQDNHHLVYNTGYQVISKYDDYGAIPTFDTLDDFKEVGLCGISFYAGKDASDCCQEINTIFKGVIHAFHNGPFVDTVPEGCSKGAGLNKLKEILGVADIAGIGDSYNDLSFLAEAKPSFTFTSSPEDVKEKVDFLVSSVAEALAKIK